MSRPGQGLPPDGDVSPDGDLPARHVVELRKEALTMALYVAICLLAALLALPDGTAGLHVGAIVWGVTIGLAVAHWFAFQVSARMVGAGAVRTHDVRSAAAQLLGAGVVAVLATVPVLIFDRDRAEVLAVEIVLAAFIAVIGYAVARTGGSTVLRAVAYSATVLVIALAIALVKNALTGH